MACSRNSRASEGHKSIVRLDVYNFLNLLNSDWGVTSRVSSGFYENRRLVTVAGVQNGQYVYNLGAPGTVPWENYAVYDASGTNRPASCRVGRRC